MKNGNVRYKPATTSDAVIYLLIIVAMGSMFLIAAANAVANYMQPQP